jgi:sodium/proline symporter
MSLTLLGFILYLAVILLVGFLTYKSNKDHRDFFLGGNRLGAWVIALSERASGESAFLILGLSGAAYASGLMEFWTALGCVSGIIFYWLVIARDLRQESGKLGAITLPDFFAYKFPQGAKPIRIIAAFIIIFFFTFYLSAQINGAGKVFYVTFGLSHFWGMIIGISVIVLYTMLGGFFAVAWTDFVQAILMFGTLVMLPLIGLTEIIVHQESLPPADFSQAPFFLDLTGGAAGFAAAALIINGLSWSVGYMGQPHLLVRFMALRDVSLIPLSRRIAFIWTIPAFTGAILIGIVGARMYGLGYFKDVENVMPHLANDLLPTWLAGIFISGSIAAMMSTADSQLLVISSSVIQDVYHKTFGKSPSGKIMLKLSRIVTLIVGITSFGIAMTSGKLIFSMVSYAWAGLGASFGPAMLLSLKWKKTTWQGIVAGLLAGSISTIIWTNIDILENAISSRLSAFLIALAAIYITSRVTQEKMPR